LTSQMTDIINANDLTRIAEIGRDLHGIATANNETKKNLYEKYSSWNATQTVERELVQQIAQLTEPEPEEEPGPPTDHVVFLYEFGDYKRTIPREFTDEDAIKFAEEYNRTGKNYGRRAVPACREEEPEPQL